MRCNLWWENLDATFQLIGKRVVEDGRLRDFVENLLVVLLHDRGAFSMIPNKIDEFEHLNISYLKKKYG